MGWEAWATIAVVVLVLLALARNLAGPDVVLTGGMVLLMTLSVFSGRFPGPGAMAREFGNEGLLTVAVLFVVAAGLAETGGLSLITERLLGRPDSVRTAQMRMMLPVAGISAFLNNTPVVAMFVPVIGEWAKRMRISPSKLLMPLSYAAILGGLCTLIGTSTNLVVQGLLLQDRAADPSFPIFSMWTLGAVGFPVLIVGLAYIVIFSRWLLPERKPAMIETMEDPRQYTIEMMVQPGSAIDGQTVEKAGLRHLVGTYLMEIQRDGETMIAVGPEQVLRGNDRLIFVGIIESVVDLQKIRGLVPATDQVFKLTQPRANRVLVEAVVSRTCPLVDQTIREGRFRTRYDAAVIAVHRNGERIRSKIGDIVVKEGDVLLLEAHPSFAERHRNSRDFFLVSAVENSHPRRHEKAWTAIAILAGLVAAMSMEQFTNFRIFNVALIAAALMVLTRCVSPEQARRSIDWSTLIAIGAAFGIGRAMEATGAAQGMASAMLYLFSGLGPWGVLAGVYLLALIFTEVVTNNAAAVLSYPIAKAAALTLGVSFMPFAVAIAIAASAGFATPLGYQTHLMVYGPGGYRFGDFLRFGVPLDLLAMGVTVAIAPIVFPF